MTKLISIIARVEKEGWWVWSPQCPGLVAGEATEAALLRSLPETIAYYFEDDDIDDFDVRVHVEREAGDGVFVRVARDGRQAARQEVADRIVAALAVPDVAARLRKASSDRFGEVIYVCGLPTDTRAWLENQLDEKHGPVNVAIPVSGTTLWARAFGDEPVDADPDASDAMSAPTFGEAARASDQQRVLVLA